jgi:large subunit ribosomal protein L22
MISKASVSFTRISPRKMRYVIDLVRAKTVPQAQAILAGSPRRGREIVQKLLDAALDAAKKNSQIEADQLMISKILADGGPSMKRFRAATMGRANRIKKRTSHVQLELDLAKKGAIAPSKPAKASETKSATKHGGFSTGAKKTGSKKLVGAK